MTKAELRETRKCGRARKAWWNIPVGANQIPTNLVLYAPLFDPLQVHLDACLFHHTLTMIPMSSAAGMSAALAHAAIEPASCCYAMNDPL